MWKEAPVPKTSSIRLAVSTELRLVTETDRHWATASTRTSIASRGKNNKHYRASL